MDEKELRKEWLKRRFVSYDYHEELLRLHEEYLQTLKRHWARNEIQKQYPDIYEKMVTPVFYNFDMITKPGEIARSAWGKGSKAMTASSITYNFARGLGDMGYPFDPYAGMPESERDRLNAIARRMLDMSANIRHTVDQRWDDRLDILNEEYTGPIDYPANWKEEISAALGLSTETHPSSNDARCEAKQPCPRTGFWWTPAKQGSRRYFNQGEIMPDLPASQYGATIWYWDRHQG
jgi:hypothetical protein